MSGIRAFAKEVDRKEALIMFQQAANQLDCMKEFNLANKLTRIMYKLAKPADMTKAEEKYWKEAEKAVEDTYDPDKSDAQAGKYYGTVTNIFKAKVKKHLGYDPFKKKKKKEDGKPKGKGKKKKSGSYFPLVLNGFADE